MWPLCYPAPSVTLSSGKNRNIILIQKLYIRLFLILRHFGQTFILKIRADYHQALQVFSSTYQMQAHCGAWSHLFHSLDLLSAHGKHPLYILALAACLHYSLLTIQGLPLDTSWLPLRYQDKSFLLKMCFYRNTILTYVV